MRKVFNPLDFRQHPGMHYPQRGRNGMGWDMPPQKEKKKIKHKKCEKNRESNWLMIKGRLMIKGGQQFIEELKTSDSYTHCLSTAFILRESAWQNSWKEIATTNTSTANYSLKVPATSLPALSSTGAVGLEYKVDGVERKWSCSLTEVVRVEVGGVGWRWRDLHTKPWVGCLICGYKTNFWIWRGKRNSIRVSEWKEKFRSFWQQHSKPSKL